MKKGQISFDFILIMVVFLTMIGMIFAYVDDFTISLSNSSDVIKDNRYDLTKLYYLQSTKHYANFYTGYNITTNYGHNFESIMVVK